MSAKEISEAPGPTKKAKQSVETPEGGEEELESSSLRSLIVAMSKKLDLIQSQLAADRSRLGAVEEKCTGNVNRLNVAESRISVVEDKVSELSIAEKRIQTLEDTVVELENRNRRNNIRVYGLPEGVEKEEPARFLEQWLPRALKLQLEGPLEIQRAHRIPSRRPASGATSSRPMIAYILRFTQVDQILRKARELKTIEYAGHKIFVGPDYARQTAAIRKRFLDQRPRMRALQMRYGLLYPARLLVTWRSKDVFFTDPNELAGFLDKCEADRESDMEASTASCTSPPRTVGPPPPRSSPSTSANRWAALFKDPKTGLEGQTKNRNRNRSPRQRRHRSTETTALRDPDLRSPRK